MINRKNRGGRFHFASAPALIEVPYSAQYPMHEVAPSAVTIAVAIDAINCTINLTVSFLLIVFIF